MNIGNVVTYTVQISLWSLFFNRLTVLNISQENVTRDSPFNRTKYENKFFTRLVPACSQSLLQTDMKMSRRDMLTNQACPDFSPSLSNHGLCLSRNAANSDDVFKSNPHLSAFKSSFRPKHYIGEVETIPDDSTKHIYTFFVDGNLYKDLKRGIEWNITKNHGL